MVDWLVADAYGDALRRATADIRAGRFPTATVVTIQDVVDRDGLPCPVAWAMVRELQAEGLVTRRRGGFRVNDAAMLVALETPP